MRGFAAGLAVLVLLSWASAAEENIATLRGAAISDSPDPAPMAGVVNKDLRQVRNYPEQPPTIPHSIRDYQIDLRSNKCLTCHSRTATGESQAPMVSITHFMDREGQFLASVSPRRYFCNQCHVTQSEARPSIENTFEDIGSILSRLRRK
ncbi:MAG: nitrate reductase cytochrome c-type subunit [Rhodospirillales bacterium]|jgi:cytochrome c-type protein NapB|nr:nitrate reductase cytochrome c-type subunit [Rhodospirillales bacterium]MDP6804191.1 nitrate reductase cytochrome c-type subunit [Rhodospirillales bacterium]